MTLGMLIFANPSFLMCKREMVIPDAGRIKYRNLFIEIHVCQHTHPYKPNDVGVSCPDKIVLSKWQLVLS